MAQQTIFLGTNPNDGTGESLRGGGSIINSNFTELYALQSDTINAGAVDYNFTGATNEQRIALADADAVLLGKSRLFIPASMLPYDLSLCPASAGVQRVREGGTAWDVYDALAYGATLGGSTNTGAAIQAALNEAAGAGVGNVVVLAPGIWGINQKLIHKSGVRLTGPGGALVYDPSVDSSSARLKVMSGAGITAVVDMSGTTAAEISDLEIDGNNIAGPIDGILSSAGTQHTATLSRVRIRRCSGWGVNWRDMTHSWLIQSCYIESNTLGGVKLLDSNDGTFDTGCKIHHNTGVGVLADSSNTVQFLGGKIEWNDSYGLQMQNACVSWQVDSVYFDRSAKAGLYVVASGASKCTFDNCHWLRNSADDLNTGDDDRSNVYLNGMSSSQFANCIFDQSNSEDDGSGIAVPRQGLVINNTTRMSFLNCHVRDGSTSSPNDFIRNGTNSFLRFFGLGKSGDYHILMTNSTGANEFALRDESATQLALELASHCLEGIEISDPPAPAANRGRLYIKDNGAGKTQLVIRFPTGAVQVIATEP